MRLLFHIIFFAFVCPNAFSQLQYSSFFDSNKSELTKQESEKLHAWMTDNPDVKIVAINGFTDEDGTSGFNDTLATRRVNHIFKIVSPKIKTREDFRTRSFGEQHKQSDVKAENRKVTIHYIAAKDIPREDEILGIVKTPPTPKPKKEYPDKLSFTNPDGSRSEFKLDTNFMREVENSKAGDKLTLQNLNFRVNTFAIMPDSRGKLYELLLVLQNNPQMKIDIQGHLCCMPTDRLDLSTQRAKAIYNFLVSNEISKSRLSYKGFGSSQPIHSIPEKSEAERAANRRVEIFIVEN